MEASPSQTTCQHELVFLPSLDDAASCARCGAIVLIAPPRSDERGVTLEWLTAPRDMMDGDLNAPQSDD